jgi:DnaK suppressor protein
MPKKRKKMDKKTLKEFEEALLAQKEKIYNSLRGQLSTLGDDKEERNVLTSDDLGSAAKAVEEEDVACILAESESRELADINEALVKIKDGTFGVCEGCDEPIPMARLEAIPNTAFCLPCKSIAEKQGSGFVRNMPKRELKETEEEE